MTPPAEVRLLPATGVGEVVAGADLAAVLAGAWPHETPRDGDVVVVTSKVVSKAEGRVVEAGTDPEDPRGDAVRRETDRVVALRGRTRIVRTHHGFTMAAAGVDASNVEVGRLVLLPTDPDASARSLRQALAAHWGANVGVVVADTSGRAWRQGQTDVALGAAGLVVLDDHAGRTDAYGNPLVVTAPAVADEIAGAAELVSGKLSGCPAVLVRGLERLVLSSDDDGPGGTVLVRGEHEDLFGLGARDAVVAAVAAAGRASVRGFGATASLEELAAAVRHALGAGPTLEQSGAVVAVHGLDGATTALLGPLLTACGWRWAAPTTQDPTDGVRPAPTIEPERPR